MIHHCRHAGFSYIEALVAVVLLAIVAVPAADAVKTGLDASRIGAAKAQELRCMKNAMETALAEPYQNLWNAALGSTVPSSYSQALDAACPARNVFISKYRHPVNGTPQFDPKGDEKDLEAVLLYVTVSSPQNSYTFTTLVAR